MADHTVSVLRLWFRYHYLRIDEMSKKQQQPNDQDVRIEGDDPFVEAGGPPLRKRRQLSEQERAARDALKIARFRKMANGRVPKALRALQQCARLANRATYSCTPEQARQLVGLLKGAVARIEDAFTQTEKLQLPEQLF